MSSAGAPSSSSPKVWITRTDSSAPRSAKALRAAGYTPLVGPLLTLTVASTPAAAPPDTACLAFTSPNGVKAFAALTDRRNWPVFTVGQTTAKLATEAGFQTVFCGRGDVVTLAELIIAQVPCELVHLSGVHVAGDLVGMLQAAGLSAKRTIIYGTEAVKSLPDNARAVLTSDNEMTVFLYSPKGARAFLDLMNKAKFSTSFSRLSLISISRSVDAVLGTHVFKSRHIARTPDEPAMLAALELARAQV